MYVCASECVFQCDPMVVKLRGDQKRLNYYFIESCWMVMNQNVDSALFSFRIKGGGQNKERQMFNYLTSVRMFVISHKIKLL